ncbi:LCP family protein [Limosilactobacillus mucosae]|uniref:LCP family protein n=1 Tax=Limosilactobacillus mucosae TaxID=97478 RepID=UPI0022E84A82|nr:LCP family protein [Limosilactobacillus mucosae]
MNEELNQNQPVHHSHHHHHHHRRKRLGLKILWSFIGLLVILVLIFAGVAWRNVHVATDNMYSESGAKTYRNADKVLKQGKSINILLLGTDTGALGRNYKGRTDTIMMMTLNPQKKTTTIVSLPRDMKVNLPGYSEYSPAKLNAAYTYGGVKETINTVQKYFNVPIDYYVMVNMGGLEKAINQIGGVSVTSPLTFDYEGYSFKKGQTYHMNGAQALAFSRMRYDDPQGDYGRQERQRLVITALMKEAASYKSVLNQKFLNSIADQSKTNLTFSDMTTLAMKYRKANGKVVSDHAQGHGDSEGGESFEVVPTSEMQRVSDEICDALQLKHVSVTD